MERNAVGAIGGGGGELAGQHKRRVEALGRDGARELQEEKDDGHTEQQERRALQGVAERSAAHQGLGQWRTAGHERCRWAGRAVGAPADGVTSWGAPGRRSAMSCGGGHGD